MPSYGTGDQVAASVPSGGVAGWGTWNLPNLVGPLYRLSPIEAPVLTLTGGLTGGMNTDGSPVFAWQDTLHRAPAIQSVVEGDDPTYSAQKRSARKNVVAIHQYGVELSYTKQAAVNYVTPIASTGHHQGQSNPVTGEMSWQLQIKLEQAAMDVEKMFLQGTYAFPTDGTARQTQGLEGAITDVALDAGTADDIVPAASTATAKQIIDAIMKAGYDNGWTDTVRVLMLNSAEKVDLESYAQSTNWNLQPRSSNSFGVNVTRIMTSFGDLDIVLNRHLTAQTALFLNTSKIGPVFMPIPDKGHFFIEPMAKAGAYDRAQLYGEIGLAYGPQKEHAVVTTWGDVAA